jgi:hypothetical protein
MSENFFIGNRRLIPLKEVSKIVPYSREYVARLARDGRVAAAQINRQWYIDPESLKNFFDQAQLEMQARGEYVRELRKQELDLHEWWSAFVAQQHARSAGRSGRALKQSFVIIILGIFVGLMVTRLAPLGDPAVLASLIDSRQLAALMSAPEKDTPVSWYETGDVVIEDESMLSPVGILLLPDGVSEDPAAFFSDEVTVEETGPTSGIIRSQVSSSSVPFVRVKPIEQTDAAESAQLEP